MRVQLQRIGGDWVLVEPKAARSRRTLYLPPGVVGALRRHRERQERERAEADWEESGLVFTTSSGRSLDARNLVHHFHATLRRAGIARRPFHTLRHTAVSLLLAGGVDIRVVQGVLGHAHIALTADLYAHLTPALLAEAAGRMEQVLNGER